MIVNLASFFFGKQWFYWLLVYIFMLVICSFLRPKQRFSWCPRLVCFFMWHYLWLFVGLALFASFQWCFLHQVHGIQRRGFRSTLVTLCQYESILCVYESVSSGRARQSTFIKKQENCQEQEEKQKEKQNKNISKRLKGPPVNLAQRLSIVHWASPLNHLMQYMYNQPQKPG